jgi:acetolactate synthase-1/2/3 large subunit
MGVAIGYGIGAQIANKHKTVICIDGDGSFNMNLSDLQTIKRYNLPIKIAIMNDSCLSMVRTWEKLFYNGRYTATDNPNNPDYVQLAESYGIKSIYCDNINNLSSTIKYFINFKGPILCDFRVKSDECLPLVKPGGALDDMILFKHFNKQDYTFNKTDLPG